MTLAPITTSTPATGYRDRINSIIEHETYGLLADLPVAGAEQLEKYHAVDTGDTFRWIGSAWVHWTSTARAEAASGSTAHSGFCAFTSLTATVAGIFSIVTGTPGANTGLQIAKAGLYRFSPYASGVASTLSSVSLWDDTGEVLLTSWPEDWNGPKQSVTFRVAANTVFNVAGTTGTTANWVLDNLIVERVGP